MTAVATIAPSGLATGVAAGTTDITASQDGVTSNTATLTVTAPTLTSISVTPSSPSIAAGQTQQFTATGTYSDTSTGDITATAAWSSSVTAMATIDASGLATGVATGTTDITASQGSVTSNAATLTVTPPILMSISVTPTSPSIAAGQTQQFTATGTYSDSSTGDITATAAWNSSVTAVATIDLSGLATGVSAGTSSITASQDGVTSNAATLTVTAPTLTSISVAPSSPSIAAGQTQQFTATGTYSDSSTGDITATAAWNSSVTAVATIDLSGLATGVSAGTSSITASQDGVTSNAATLTVTAPTLTSISVAPSSPSIAAGQTQQFTATGTYSDSSTADITATATWNSSVTPVATINPSGLATGVSAGTSSITATQDGVTSNAATLAVAAPTLTSISVTPTSPSIAVGQTQQFTATGTYSDTSTADITATAIWNSSSTAVATIAPSALATGVSAGTTSITTAQDGVTSNTATLTVTAPGLFAIETGVVQSVGNSGWTTVTLNSTYTSMVVVCSPNYDKTMPPAVVRVRNTLGNSFEVRLDNTDGATTISGVTVHYMVVEEGVYTEAEHGVKMEAVKYNSTVTDWEGSWVGESRSYSNTYSSPVVLGQVITYNDSNFSVFWCRGSSKWKPPSSSTLRTGKHVGEDPNQIRANETIGYIVIEAGNATIGITGYAAGLGSDSIRGVGNSPPYSYSLSGLSSVSAAIVSQAAMHSDNGGWSILYGSNPVSTTSLNLAIDEDQAGDSERRHTTQQVGYIVFGTTAPPAAPMARANPSQSVPEVSALPPNYPNPANPETWIPFKLSKASDVTIRIYDSTGRLVRTLDLGHTAPGNYVSRGRAAYWDGRNQYGDKVSSGIYFYEMQAGSYRAIRKMVITK